MSQYLFLGHYSRDSKVAQVIATTISRATLGQIDVWYTSDFTSSGGVAPGQVWIEEIKRRLRASSAVVALLTPMSISRPWIYFESGFAAARAECNLVPICVGIGTSQVPFPLSLYQCFQLVDRSSLSQFLAKLFHLYSVKYDEELLSPLLEEAIKGLVNATTADDSVVEDKTWKDIVRLNDDLKQHIDRRFLDLVESQLHSSSGVKRNKQSEIPTYPVPVYIEMNDSKTKQVIDISAYDNVQDVLDNVYRCCRRESDHFSI